MAQTAQTPESVASVRNRSRGKIKRQYVPRSAHAKWAASPDRTNPLDLLKEQGAGRLQEIVPLRYERMGVSAFTFYRGAALIMASDLATIPDTGLRVQTCGDAHIANFGGFASPERRLVFDINDFDETVPGPWEWDVKRLATSVEICGRDRGFTQSEKQAAVLATVRSYREAMQEFSQMTNLEVWYAKLDVEDQLIRMKEEAGKKRAKAVRKGLDKAYAKDSIKAVEKFTEVVDGALKIVSNPPLIVPLNDFLPHVEAEVLSDSIKELFGAYLESLPSDRRSLLGQFSYVDCAQKVVGVGSVGTRAWIVVLSGRDENDVLVLQLKEAQASVFERFVGESEFSHHGRRVVEGQRLMQASSDIMLGWARSRDTDGIERDYYIRQLWDWKTSPDLDTIAADELLATGQMCGWTLARAHARSGNRFALAGYLGTGTSFDKAIAKFSLAYADQNEADWATFMQARAAGEL